VLRRTRLPSRLACLLLAAAAFLLASGLWARKAQAKEESSTPDPMTLEVPGFPDAYYFKPRSKSARPILMYLHGRGGNAFEDCRKWARVARQFGWVVCPQGGGETDSGGRTWGNDADGARRVIDATVAALKQEYKGRVRTRNNILIGFSEGAYIAQQVGLRDPAHWNRWLILAANDKYWWGDAPQLLETNRAKIRRVYLFTGENDQVAENTKRVGEMLKDAHIRVRVRIAPGLGHEVPADRMITNYRRPLRWLARGG
jgi:predicted esterase